MTDAQNTTETAPLLVEQQADTADLAAAADASESRSRPSVLSLCIPLILHVFAVSMAMLVSEQWLVLAVCDRMRIQTLVDAPDAAIAAVDWPSCAGDPAVQSAAAQWNIALSLSSSLPALVAGPLFGALSDSWGRRFLFMLPLLGSIIGFSGLVLVSTLRLPIATFVVFFIITGLLGGWQVFLTAVFAYVADTTAPEGRARIYVLGEACLFIAFATGPIVGGALTRVLPVIEQVFYIAICIEIVALIYVIFLLPESLQKSTQTQSRPRTRSASDGTQYTAISDSIPSAANQSNVSIDHEDAEQDEQMPPKSGWHSAVHEVGLIFNGMADVFKLAFNRTFIILVTTVCVTFASLSARSIFFKYASYTFGWDAYVEGKFMLVSSIARIFHMLVTFPAVQHVCKISTASRESKIKFDLNLIRACTLVGSCSTLALGMVWQSWMVFTIPPVDGFTTLASPNIRSLMSRSVPSCIQGKLFAAVQFLEQIIMVIFSMVFPAIWAATVGTPYSNLFLVLTAGLFFVAFGLMLFTRVDEIGQADDLEPNSTSQPENNTSDEQETHPDAFSQQSSNWNHIRAVSDHANSPHLTPTALSPTLTPTAIHRDNHEKNNQAVLAAMAAATLTAAADVAAPMTADILMGLESVASATSDNASRDEEDFYVDAVSESV